MADEPKTDVEASPLTHLGAKKRKYFSPRVERAKKALDKATEHATKKLVTIIDKQAELGKDDLVWKLIEHYESPDGERLVAPSVDKQKQLEGDTGPRILINLPGLGGHIQPATSLPVRPEVKVIDIEASPLIEGGSSRVAEPSADLASASSEGDVGSGSADSPRSQDDLAVNRQAK